MRSTVILLAMLGVSAPALAADEVSYGNVPDWVVESPEPVLPQQRQGAFSILARDFQVHLDEDGQHVYENSFYLIQTAEGLPLGNLNIIWNPAAGGPTVHAVNVIRDGEVIDILDDQRFNTFQREGGLEQSILDGLLTASLQIPGLRVGDQIQFSLTTRSQDPTLPDRTSGIMALPAMPSAGSYRGIISWDEDHEPSLQLSDDIADIAQRNDSSIVIQLDQPEQHFMSENAPIRHAPARMVEYSDYSDWQEVSRRLYPLYEDAAEIPRGSELHDDVARIMRNHDSESERARAALRLVQDQVRYVYVGMNGGNLTPAKVEETWERRYGDCKAKTVMLLALLEAMGIEAHPVAVSLGTLGDGIESFLPGPGQFDHVLVRAVVDGQQVWLDGTRHGDARANPLPPEPFRNVLPITKDGADLEPLPFIPLEHPQRLDIIEIDATDGVDRNVRMTSRSIVRGSEALQLRSVLQSLAPDALDQALRQLAGGESSWIEIQELDWSFDEEHAAITFSASGIDRLDWDAADDWAITDVSIPGAGFYPPPERRRPPQQDRSLPYVNNPHRYDCNITTIKLPAPFGQQGWEHDVDAMNQEIGGVAYWRAADLTAGEVRTIMSVRTVRTEITAEEAATANDAIPDFDNAVSDVFLRRQAEEKSQLAVAAEGIDRVPSSDDVNWLEDSSACRTP